MSQWINLTILRNYLVSIHSVAIGHKRVLGLLLFLKTKVDKCLSNVCLYGIPKE